MTDDRICREEFEKWARNYIDSGEVANHGDTFLDHEWQAWQAAWNQTTDSAKLQRAKELCSFYESRLKPSFEGSRYTDEIDRLIAIIESTQQWISVKERLPEDQQKVAFVTSPECRSFPAFEVLGGKYVSGPYNGFSIPGIGGIPATHWMPMLDPPEAA